ncbi:MAG: hypothetical protein RI949_1863 [Pseudomonadota bacterium]|jgi:tRNA threonylcarbamoyladenosine biosynthesis protein TsaB
MNTRSLPTLLALDTSTQEMSLAVQAGNQSKTWQGPGGAAASAQLLTQISQLLAHSGVQLRALQAVAFGCGPGAFTGLRAACSVAQGLAMGADVDVIAVDSLMLVAEAAWADLPSSPEGLEVGVLMDARMGEVYAARYERHDGAWQVIHPPVLCDPDAVQTLWGGWPSVVTGSGVSMAKVPSQVLVVQARDRAAALLRLALRGFEQGRGVDAASALPVYLRDKVAMTTAERQAAAMSRPTLSDVNASGDRP